MIRSSMRTLAFSGLGVVALLAASVSPATADNVDDWVAGPNTTFPDNTTVHFDVTADNDYGYVYNVNLDHPVHAGDVLSYHLSTKGQTYCTDFSPYVYLQVGDRGFSSYADGTPCPGNQTWTLDDGDVDFTITEDGTIGYIDVEYYDNDGNGGGGIVEISNIRINNEPAIKFGPDPAPPPPCQGAECPHVATAFGGTLSHGRYGRHHRRCVVKAYAFVDAANEGTYADPQQRIFTARVDGHVRRSIAVAAGDDGRMKFRVQAHTGKRIVNVRTEDGQLVDRMRLRTGRC